MKLDPFSLSVITAIASLLGAVGGCFAAFAAFRSAGAAKAASDHAAHAAALEKRAQLRELAGTSNEIVAATLRVDGLANRCKQELRTLSTFTGGTGASREQFQLEAIEKKQSRIGPIQAKAREVSGSISDFQKESEDRISSVQSELDNLLIQTNRIKEELQDDLVSYDDQNRTYREKVVSNT